MAVRCLACGRLSRDETVCEWCRIEIPPAARPLAASRAAEVTEREAHGESRRGIPHSPPGPVDTGSPEAATAGAGQAPESVEEKGRSTEDGTAEHPTLEEVAEKPEWHWDNETRAIIGLILLQFVLTLYLGRLSSWWSITGFLWLLVGYGVIERLAWSLALPLVLFTLDVALLLFGIGPRQRAGFLALAPLDFFLYLLRLVTWALIWRLQDQMD